MCSRTLWFFGSTLLTFDVEIYVGTPLLRLIHRCSLSDQLFEPRHRGILSSSASSELLAQPAESNAQLFKGKCHEMLSMRTSFFVQIVSIEDYWNWLEDSFIDNIYVADWYNGQAATNLNGFLNDKASRLIGWATIRQLRVKKGSHSLTFRACHQRKASFAE